jgi:hypothetical protein
VQSASLTVCQISQLSRFPFYKSAIVISSLLVIPTSLIRSSSHSCWYSENMPVCIAAREDHRWHSGLTPEQACNSEDTEAQKDLGLTQVVDAPRTLHFTPQEDATTNVFSYIFVVGDHYMHLEFRNKEVFWASAGERRIISMDPSLSSQIPATCLLLHC